MTIATVGSRYQVVIPRAEREAIGLKPHTKVMVETRNNCVVLYSLQGKRLRGIGRGIAEAMDATDYVRRLR